MNRDIEPFSTSSLRHTINERFPQPSWLTSAGVKDREAEASHTLAMRTVGRNIELHQAQTFQALAAKMNELDAEARILSETKWRAVRAKKESQVLADDDAELQAMFAVLDGDYFHRNRANIMFGHK